jgi:fluoroquinolone transport system ATP-binding protein
LIAARGLSFRYGGAREPAVRELSFEVAAGEIFGFLGPSGSGKSTTQKILIGLLAGYAGEVRVLDKDRAHWTSDDYERIGVSFETPNHFSKLSGLENLRYFGALYRRSTREPAAVLAALGLESDGDTPVAAWSKGMRARLSIARCLLHDPEVLFLDEPTAGLDPVNAQRVKALIQAERAAGRTVFLTTHDMTVADELCDRVAFLVDGRIVSVDAPRVLKLRHGERTVRVEFRDGGGVVSRDFPLDGIGRDEAFRALLASAEIETIHSREASLADVFIAVTGRTLS